MMWAMTEAATPSLATGQATFEIHTKGPSGASIVVNDEDISKQVIGLRLDMGVHRVHELHLQLCPASGVLVGEGIVYVHEDEEDRPPLGDLVAAWLNQINADTLMGDALRNAAMGTSSATLILGLLAEKARQEL